MMWRTDKELIEESLKKAFRVEQDSDQRFDALLARLRESENRNASSSEHA